MEINKIEICTIEIQNLAEEKNFSSDVKLKVILHGSFK